MWQTVGAVTGIILLLSAFALAMVEIMGVALIVGFTGFMILAVICVLAEPEYYPSCKKEHKISFESGSASAASIKKVK